MKKRLLAMMMAFVMAMSLLPMSALAVGGGNSEQPPEQPIENPGVTFTKELIPGESGNPDKIKLEAYVDGEVKEENVPVDCDIVLVLDQSGSMVEKITDSKYEKVQQPSGGWTYNTVNDKDYYYFDGKNYRPVKAEYDKEYERCWDRNCDQYHEWNWIHTKKYHVTTEYYLEYGDGNVLGNKATSPDEVLYTGDLYKLVSAGSTTRLQAMKDAAQTFIDAVQDAEGNHRVAVVGFASDSDNYNNAKYENSEVLTAPTSNGNSKVYSRVTGELKTDGSQTYYIAVAETAEYREINYNSNFKMWQDGFTIIDPATTPIYIAKNPETYVGKKYDTLTNVEYQAALVAPDSKALENAIGALAAYGGTYGYLGLTMAKNIFDKAPAVEGSTDRQKVIVYITDGEDSKKDKARKVADALAGTGYNAEIYSIFVGTLPTNESKKNAIVSFLQKDIASSEDNYANASNSEQLKKFIQEIATGSTTKTEIKANLTDKTVMTDEISDYFKVSGDIEVYTAAKNAPGEASEWADEQQLKDGVTVDVNGKTVTVTGFNFAANCVTSTDKGDGDYGKKLVVYIPIKEDDIGFGGYLPTNASATLKDDTTNEDFSTDPAYKDCEVSAPVLTGKTVDRVALYDLPSIADLFTHDKTPDGSNNAGVNMVYTLKQGDTTIATKSVSAGKAFDQAEWVWTDGYADKVDDMQAGTYTYTLDCQVTCIKDHNPAVVADSDQATATVNIRNLTFTFDANGGSWADEVSGYTMNEGNTTAAIEANMGDKIAQIATEPTRKGYEFLGWYSKNKKGDLTAKWWGSDDFSYKIYEDDTVYAKWEEIPTEPTPADKTGKLYVNLQDEKGTWLGGTNEAIPVTNEYTVSFTAGENVDYEAPEVITTASGDRYIYDCVVSYSAPLTGTLQKDGENIVVCLQYTKDNWNDEEDKTTGGDGIPDKYQAVVIYKVAGGTWDGTDAADKTYVFTLKEKDAATGEWENVTPAPTLNGTIPNVENAKPDATHTTPAYWTPTPRATDVVKSGTTIYTYTFTTANKLTFTFDANGGSWADEVSGYTMNEGKTTASIEAIMGTEIAQIATEPTRKGYEFLGWYSKNKKGDLTAKWWGSDDFSYKIYEDDTVYAKWEEIPTEPTPADKTGKLYVNLQDEKGTWLGGTNEAIPVTNEYTVSFTAGENVDYEAPEVITTASGDRYIYDCVVSYSAPLTGTLQKADENIVVCLQYTKDNWNDKDDETTGGDGIPDKYQAVVLFKSKDEAKGTVTGDGIVQVFTFSQPEGDKTVYLEKGTVDPDMTKVTATAKSGYKFDIWTKDEGTTSVNPATAIENVAGGTIIEFYANWAAKENNTGGGGSSKPPVLNKEDHYAYIVGYPDGTVKPQGNITRAEVATIFFRMLTDDSRNEFWSQTNSYSDVSEGQWFNNAISTLANAGILSGYPDGTFRPNAPITRAEFTKIAASFFERVEYTIDNPFNDVDDDDWFYKFVMAAYEGGLITGYPEGDFRPNANISRAESVTIVNRTLERAPDADHFLKDMIVWPDNAENAWYYEAVQEATNSHEYVVKGTGTNKYEEWTKILEVRDWPALEKEWSNANSATGGEVVK